MRTARLAFAAVIVVCVALAVVWDGEKNQFQTPFDATGKKWVRFAVWDPAGNGAFVQPVKLRTKTSMSAGQR